MIVLNPETPTSRGRFRVPRAPLPVDVVASCVLLGVEVLLYVWLWLGGGLQIWAAGDDSASVDATLRTELARTQWLLFAALALVVVAAVLRAPWTFGSQLLAAAALTVLLTLAQQGYDRTHPTPAPAPTGDHQPCYSGSGTCN
ncbi:DUF6234 family protein [Streptacidiphilus jiangxiensis]|uniref:DUF6234 domain-containing protein n=1 Tax=Streptacidiphilus jiangxiensis TaxID=235985 RepID=A0A1H7TQM6_STRJI|nr:DUF6234 family protein [Streptacidiphilus jiangxiensis]SEL86988.1 hypothetical protein SAMN05414137_114143 [Streptacidiphilus jiangxiensis]